MSTASTNRCPRCRRGACDIVRPCGACGYALPGTAHYVHEEAQSIRGQLSTGVTTTTAAQQVDLHAWSAAVGPFDDRHYCGKDVTVADVKRAVTAHLQAAQTTTATLAFVTTAMAAGYGDDLPAFATRLRTAAEQWYRVEPLIEALYAVAKAVDGALITAFPRAELAGTP